MRKIHITQKQLEECMYSLNEINLNGDAYLKAKNGDVKSAAQASIDDAQSSGVNTASNDASVSFSADALKNNAGISEGRIITKKQIQEARINNMMKNSTCYTKSALKKGLK